MSQQTSQQIAAPTSGTSGRGFKFAAVTAAVIVTMFFTAGTAAAGNIGTQNVNVVNTPTVNVGNTPTVNANATITAPGPLTNVGRLASQHLTLQVVGSSTCPTHLQQTKEDGSNPCFDLANDPGQALVITDVSFWGQGTAGNTCGMVLFAPGGGNLFLVSVATAAADGVASKSEHLTTGFAMTGNPVVGLTCSVHTETALMQGYLVPNQ